MAAAEHDAPLKKSSSAECLLSPSFDPLKRSSSSELLPPSMSGLRVVLLGGSWSDRSSVGNFILGVNSSINNPTSCLKLSGRVEDRLISVINTPDPPLPTEDFIKDSVDVSDPGPHVFLLVLQPEDFTDEEKDRISTVLQAISDRSFEHSFILILTPRQESSDLMENFMKRPTIKDLIKKCSYRYLMMKNTDLPELLTRFDQIVKENNGKYVIIKRSEETKTSSADQNQNLNTSAGSPGAAAAAEGVVSALRIVLLEKSGDKMTDLVNFMVREPELLIHKPSSGCVASTGQWGGKAVTAVKTPDMFSLSVVNIRKEVKNCMSLCPPGPNVLLLLVNPSDFTEDDREALKLILNAFGQDALKYSMVIMTHTEERGSVTELLKDCGGRSYKMLEENQDLLMKNIEKIVQENSKTCLTFSKDTNISQQTPEQDSIPSISVQELKNPLNLVLFGSRGAEKTSAAAAILGQTGLHPASCPSESVKHEGEVCGRQVSVLEMPPLYDKPQQEVMEESFRCVSLCDPEGVHAFILILPVGPLTDEDKIDLQIIQDTFSPRVKDFIMILFTVDSDPAATAVGDFMKENREIQELCQSCGGRSAVLNIKDRQKIPELLETVDRTISSRENPTYTVTTLARGQMEEKSQLKAQLQTKTTLRDADKNQKADSLRIVLIGRSGSGKSSSGNTILEKDEFEVQSSQQSVTKSCEKAEGLVDGRPVVVVDTPGLFDNSLSPEDVDKEVGKCLSLLAPGPHVFLLVFQTGSFSPEDSVTFKQLKETFGDQSEKFTIVLFTRGDELELEKKTIEEYIEDDCDDSFKKLMFDCGQRYHVFNNYDKQNRVQVSELMMKIDTMLTENRGSCYIRQKLQDAAEEEETSSKNMEEIEKDIKEKQKAWERERKELEEKRRQEDEERCEKQQTELKKLQDELKKEKEKHEKQRKEEQKQEQEQEKSKECADENDQKTK